MKSTTLKRGSGMDYLSIARCFGILHRRSQAFLVYATQNLHLTYSEYVLLLKLYEYEGGSQEDMAARLYVDKAVVTRAIKLLEEKDLIYREKDSQDRRMKRLYLTEFGKSQKEFLQTLLVRWIDGIASTLNEEEIRVISGAFKKLSEKAGHIDFSKV